MPQWIVHGFAGGTWFALFVLHILAPVAPWETLLLLYGAWLAGFFLCWIGLVFANSCSASTKSGSASGGKTSATSATSVSTTSADTSVVSTDS